HGRRSRHSPGRAAARIRRVLHHPGGRHGPRPADHPTHRRGARRLARPRLSARRRDRRHARAAGGRGEDPMKNVLLLEDHAESRCSLAYVLSRDGYRVLESPNGRSALAIARRERLHAFVVDLKLPDMDGLDVLREVQQLAPGVPSVVMTGYGTVDAAVEAM